MKKIKKAFTRLFKLLLGIFLLTLALVLLIVLTVCALIYGLYSLISKEDRRNIGELLDDWYKYFIALAASVDQTGNAAVGKLLTKTLVDTSVDNHSVHFDIDDTVSEITGWNELEESQTKLGKILSTILNKAEKEHGLKSAANAYWKAKNKIEKYKHLENFLQKYKK